MAGPDRRSSSDLKMNNSRDSRSGKVVVSSFCWDAPFSRWLLVLCRALVWGEPWRDRLGVMTNDLMDWVGGEPESAELVIVLDRFDQDVRYGFCRVCDARRLVTWFLRCTVARQNDHGHVECQFATVRPEIGKGRMLWSAISGSIRGLSLRCR